MAIFQIYCPTDFTWNQILTYSNGQKVSFFAILEVLNFDFSQFEQLSSPKFTNIQNAEPLKLPKNIFGLFEIAKIWFHVKSE